MHAIKQKTQQPIASVAKRKREISFSVIMPTYNQCAFIRRAIYSLMHQSYKKWELIIINDGCTDETEDYIKDYLIDKRIVYIRNEENTGLGHALNQGLNVARYDYIAYLPSDDFYFENHLESLVSVFLSDKAILLAYSGIRFAFSDTLFNNTETETSTIRSGYCLQLVQVAHRKTSERWIERSEYVTEDLFQMYWVKLADKGRFSLTRQITAQWTIRPGQRHQIISETYGGGLNQYRSFYKVKTPIKMKISHFKFIDEQALYEPFMNKQRLKNRKLKILIVGELAYNPERILALEEAGTVLYAIWTPHPHLTFSTIGPLPFGNVETIPFDEHWKKRLEEVKPDVIYGLLNAGCVSFVSFIVKQCPDIPYIWHFKEGPSICLIEGTWEKLIDLYAHASGRIFLNNLTKEWYEIFLPKSGTPSMLLDGDLPKKEYFGRDYSPKLSSDDGGIHIVITGRMIGISPEMIKELSDNNVHIHLYTANYYEANGGLNETYHQLAPKHFHIHRHVTGFDWTKEFSKYDAGWLHGHTSSNYGNLLHATWDDLNLPARISTYAAGGLPLILPENKNHLVASNQIADDLGIGIFYSDIQDLIRQLKNEHILRQAACNMLKHRLRFSFDYHVGDFLSFCEEAVLQHSTI